MVSFIVFIIGIFILVFGVLITLVLSIIQFVLNFIIANILPIGLILFGLFTLFIVLAIFLPESKQKKEENDSQHSTAQACTRKNTVSDEEESNKTTINVKSTVVKEETKSDKSYKKKKTYQASTKHSITEKPSSNTENKHSHKNSFQTQTSVSFERNVEIESHREIEREEIYYSDFSAIEPELKRLALSPSQTTIKSGETIQFELTGLDEFDNQIEISDRISWITTAGEIDSTGLFSIDSIDDALVKIAARIGEIEATATVNIESIYKLLYEPPQIPQLKSLKVVPDCIYLKPNEEQVFEALGFDRYDNSIDCGEIIWSATGGKIDQNGKLLVGNNSKGIYQVTATSKHTPKHNVAAKITLLTLGVSTRILSWAIDNEEFFYDVLAPLLNLTNEDDSLSETDALVQGWILEIARGRVAKLLKKASNLSFKEAFSNISDSIDYIVVPELRRIQFVNPPSNVKPGDCVQLNVIGFDQVGDKLDVQNRIIWTSSSGTINSQGLLTVNDDIDIVKISAKVQDSNIETQIVIKIKVNKKTKLAFKSSTVEYKPTDRRLLSYVNFTEERAFQEEKNKNT